MVRLNRIYTRTGDDGTTGLGDGQRRPKFDARVAAYGEVDELNCVIGLARLATHRGSRTRRIDATLARAQNDLFDLGADLCVPPRDDGENARRCASRPRRSRLWSAKSTTSTRISRRCVLSCCPGAARRRRRCIRRAPFAGAPSARSSLWPRAKARRWARRSSPTSTGSPTICSSPRASPTAAARPTCSGFPARIATKSPMSPERRERPHMTSYLFARPGSLAADRRRRAPLSGRAHFLRRAQLRGTRPRDGPRRRSRKAVLFLQERDDVAAERRHDRLSPRHDQLSFRGRTRRRARRAGVQNRRRGTRSTPSSATPAAST